MGFLLRIHDRGYFILYFVTISVINNKMKRRSPYASELIKYKPKVFKVKKKYDRKIKSKEKEEI